ncbi:TPR-like protein [Mycena latifolia]|nr:TPR-like protein [Mycena latifolia]
MSETIRLQSIHVKSLTNPHDDLPVDMQMFAHLILDGNIFLQTVAVGSEESQNSWKLNFGCNIPSHASTFSVAILRQSKTGVIRLLGFVDIVKGEVIHAVELNQRGVLHYQLNKVNPDGPSLKFSVDFSVSDVPATESSGFNMIDTPDNQSDISGKHVVLFSELPTVTSLQSPQMADDLQRMHDAMDAGAIVDFRQLWVMHERILLLPHHHNNRARFHNVLGDISVGCYKTSGMLDILNEAISAYGDAVRDDPSSAIYLSAHGVTLFQRFERLGDLTDINRSVSALEAAVNLSLDAHLNTSALLSRLGVALRCRFERLTNPEDIQRSVLMCETAVGLTQDGDENKPGLLNNLGNSLLRRYEHLGDLVDINQAVSRLEAAVELMQDGHRHKASLLNNLGNSLLSRFEHLGDLTDINQAVSKFEAAAELTPDSDLDKSSRLNNLGNSLRNRFEHLGNLTDINESVSKLEAAVELMQDGQRHKASLLNNLGNSLLSRFRHLGSLIDMNQAVSKLEAAVELTLDNDLDKPSWLNSLGNSLLSRFECLGDLTDINEAVSKLEAAVELMQDGHQHKASLLTTLGYLLLSRFRSLGDLADINQAVSKLEAAVELTPDGHPDKPLQLNNLGNSLLSRFEHLGDLPDSNEAVSKFEAAVELTPDSHPDMPSWLSNLGNSLCSRFERWGNLSDINQAVSKFEAAVELTPDSHRDKPSRLNNLGDSLRNRFEHLGDLTDINQAVARLEAAVKLVQDSHRDKPSLLNNLGNSLLSRFERLQDLTDMNRAVSKFEAAVELTPDGHPDKPSRLNNLGNSLRSRFECLGNLTDINESVSKLKAAVELSPDSHPDTCSCLNNLGISLLSRFEHSGELADINEAVSKLEAAVELTPEGHPAMPSWRNNLGNSLLERYRQLHNPYDYHAMLVQYTSAACSPTGAAQVRFQAAIMWARAAEMVPHPSLIQAYTTAINLLPELAWLGLSISDRHHHILQAGQVVRDAASVAIAANQLSTAVEWLEQGRSVIWGQIFNLRTPVDDLRKSHPDLADELVSYSTQLEAAGIKSHAIVGMDAGPSQSLHAVAQDAHALADKRTKLLKQIRKLAGFERFLLPKPISELSLAATMGPVVLLNITEHKCDALILMAGLQDEVMHVPLPHFTLQDAQSMAESLGSLVSGAARSERLEGHREGDKPLNEQFSQILSMLWMRIVKPVLNGIAFSTPPDQDLGRIWWCPTGPLAFLPIHAAGLYGKDRGFSSKLSDFFISSYTPSLTTLIEGLRPRCESGERLQILAVAQPAAVGQAYIPGTLAEIDCIRRLTTIPILRLERDLATVDSVQDGMRKCRWAHFACHGVQDFSDPTNSALLLSQSSRLTLSRIIQLSLPDTDLAFLSACQTATGSKTLEDESVHLTAGMLLAGYRGVIGTMWSIRDNDAPKVAGDIYAHLFKTSPPDSTRAAEALHLAIGKLRDLDMAGGTESFSHWVPFIHVGV